MRLLPRRLRHGEEAMHKSYGTYEALRGIDFEIETGEVFGLLGPNGGLRNSSI